MWRPYMIYHMQRKQKKQNLDSIIAKLSKEEKHRNGTKSRILLVSEKKNACLPLLSSDEEGEGAGDSDLHQCGHCKLMFNNLTKYITHKIQKVCWVGHRNDHRDELIWSPDRDGSCSPDENNEHNKDGNHVNDRPEQQSDNGKLNTEADNRKQHNVYGHATHSPQTTNEDRKPPSSEHLTPEGEKLNINEEGQEDDDESKSTNHAIDFMKKDLGRDSTQSESQHSRTLKISQTRHEDQTASPRSTYNASPERTRTGNSNNIPNSIEHSNKYDRVTPNLPQIMSTRGSNRIDGLHPVDKIYQSSRTYSIGRQNLDDEMSRPVDKIHRPTYDRRGEKYAYNRYHQTRYEAETESTWTSNYVDNRKNTTSHAISSKVSEDYYLSRERYTTMVGLENSKDLNRNGEKNDEYEKNIKIETVDMNSPISKEPTANVPPDINERLVTTPPELVRVDDTTDGQSRLDTPSSPLEQYNDDVKAEEHDGEDIPRSTALENVNLDDSLDDDTSIDRSKFMDLCSPGKESSSPLDISNNQDIDDLAVKENLRDSSEVQLLAHHRLSESAVEQLITVPVSGIGDPSWKHAKQVYSCPLCAKVFPFKSKLQRHVLVHTRIKPYKCTVCGRGFTQQIDLQRHLTRHTGEKPFKCHLCTAQFIRADNLRKHCKDAHYVVIEEPIRKRRRRTTGSDTVLPSLEVAIALAFSETERNGGRVLGRTVTRTNPRTPSGSGNPSENFNQFNQNLQKPSPDVSPFIGEHHTSIFTQSSSRYPIPDEMKVQYPGKSTDQFTPGSEEKEPFSPQQRKGFLTRDMPRLYENGHLSRVYLPPPDYDRDRERDRESQEYMLLRERDRRQIDPRLPPGHISSEQRYKMEYRPLSADIPNQSLMYRRSGEDEIAQKEYRRRYPEPRIALDDMDRRDKSDRYPIYAIPKGAREGEEIVSMRERDEQAERDIRASYKHRPPHLQLQPLASNSSYSRSESEKVALTRKQNFDYNNHRTSGSARSPEISHGQLDSRRQIEIREITNRAQIDAQREFEGSYRYNKSFQRNDTTVDPGEYISMATEKDNDQDSRMRGYGDDEMKHTNKNVEFIKPDELTSSQIKQYAAEEEIPIVTRSDELPSTLDET